MRKRIIIVICLVCLATFSVVALHSCPALKSSGLKNDTHQTTQKTTHQTPTVTFPRGYFQDTETTEDAIAQLDDLGCTDIVANEDGSYSASLSKDKYSALVKSEYDKAQETIESLQDASLFPDITEVSYDDNLTTVKIVLKTDSMGSADTGAPAEAGDAAIIYQTIAGLPVGCDVVVVGSSGQTLSETPFPQ